MPIETKRMNQVEFLTAGGISVPHGFTTRYGGVSTGTQASLNLAYGRGDTMENVVENLRRLGSALGFDPEKLVMTRQTHSDIVRWSPTGTAGASATKITPRATLS